MKNIKFDQKAIDKLKKDAIDEYNEIDEYCEEDGFPPPSDDARKFAWKLFNELFEKYPLSYSIYPTEDREVAIGAKGNRGNSLLLLIGSKKDESGTGTGTKVLCIVNMGGVSKYVCYRNYDMIYTDSFIFEGLKWVSKNMEEWFAEFGENNGFIKDESKSNEDLIVYTVKGN